MKEKRNVDFLKGTLSLSISVVVTKILGVAFKIPLSYVLGDSGMGYFNTAYAIYGLFYILCTAGVPKSMTLVISGCRAEGKRCEADREVLKCGVRLFAKIGAFSTLLNIICAPAFASIVGNSKATYSILAVAPSIFFVSVSGVLRGYLNSEERLIVIAVSQFIEGVIKLALGLALALFGVRIGASVGTISALAILGITVGSALSCAYMLFVAYSDKTDNKTRQSDTIGCKNIRKRILKNALPIALSATLLNISSTIDLTLIIKRLMKSGMSEAHANSIYGNYTTLAVPMFNLVISVLAPIATSYMPRLSELYLSGKGKAFSDTLKKLLTITLVISVPASLAFYFYSFDLLDVLFSLQSSAVGAEMLVTLSLGLSLLATLTVVNTALESQSKIAATVFSLLFGCFVKLVLSYFLIGNGSFAILGAPIGTVISYAVSLSISLYFLERSGVRIHALTKLILLYAVGIASFYMPYKLIYSVSLLGSSFFSMSLSLVVSLALYAISLALLYLVPKIVVVFKVHKKEA